MKNVQKVVVLVLCVALVAGVLSCGTKSSGGDAGFGPGVPVVGEWEVFTDENDKGNSTVKMEIVEREGMPAYHITGNVTTQFQYGFVGWMITPDEATLALLKTARAISFKCEGDGQRQTVKFRISSVRDYAHFEYHFFGEPGETTYVEVPVRFFQQPAWGNPTRMNQNNVEDISWQTHESWRKAAGSPFEITIWDVRVHP